MKALYLELTLEKGYDLIFVKKVKPKGKFLKLWLIDSGIQMIPLKRVLSYTTKKVNLTKEHLKVLNNGERLLFSEVTS